MLISPAAAAFSPRCCRFYDDCHTPELLFITFTLPQPPLRCRFDAISFRHLYLLMPYASARWRAHTALLIMRGFFLWRELRMSATTARARLAAPRIARV